MPTQEEVVPNEVVIAIHTEATQIVLRLNDDKWYETRDSIKGALLLAYIRGYNDARKEAKEKHDRQHNGLSLRSEGVVEALGSRRQDFVEAQRGTGSTGLDERLGRGTQEAYGEYAKRQIYE